MYLAGRGESVIYTKTIELELFSRFAIRQGICIYDNVYANNAVTIHWQPLLLRPQGSEVLRPLLRAELGEADPRPCWAPGIANWQDPVGLTVVEPEPALRHNTLPRRVSCFKIQPACTEPAENSMGGGGTES